MQKYSQHILKPIGVTGRLIEYQLDVFIKVLLNRNFIFINERLEI